MKLQPLTDRSVLDKFLPISKKSIRTFSINEHCFGDQIVNFSPIVLIFAGQFCCPLALIGVKIKKPGLREPFWLGF